MPKRTRSQRAGRRVEETLSATMPRQEKDDEGQQARRRELAAGYRATRAEGRALTQAFAACDLEGWDAAEAEW
jgi:hypothetical protein